MHLLLLGLSGNALEQHVPILLLALTASKYRNKPGELECGNNVEVEDQQNNTKLTMLMMEGS